MVMHIQTIINLLWNNWNFTPAALCSPDTRKKIQIYSGTQLKIRKIQRNFTKVKSALNKMVLVLKKANVEGLFQHFKDSMQLVHWIKEQLMIPLSDLLLNTKHSIHLHHSTSQKQQYTAKGVYVTPLEDRNHESCN